MENYVRILKAASESPDEIFIGGYASVEVVDSEGDLVTTQALKSALAGFMKKAEYRNLMLLHTNMQVGEVVESFTDSAGRLWKTEVDDRGLFIVAKIRNDIEVAKAVGSEILADKLCSYSIGGHILNKNRVCENGQCYWEIDNLELHEVTVAEQGMNPLAKFQVLKASECGKMTEEVPIHNVFDSSNIVDEHNGINVGTEGVESINIIMKGCDKKTTVDKRLDKPPNEDKTIKEGKMVTEEETDEKVPNKSPKKEVGENTNTDGLNKSISGLVEAVNKINDRLDKMNPKEMDGEDKKKPLPAEDPSKGSKPPEKGDEEKERLRTENEKMSKELRIEKFKNRAMKARLTKAGLLKPVGSSTAVSKARKNRISKGKDIPVRRAGVKSTRPSGSTIRKNSVVRRSRIGTPRPGGSSGVINDVDLVEKVKDMNWDEIDDFAEQLLKGGRL